MCSLGLHILFSYNGGLNHGGPWLFVPYLQALDVMQGDGVEIVIINKDGIRRESMPLKRD